MSISPTPSPENLRICLVGDTVNDAATVEAAQTFGVPVITSTNGLDIINDYEWRTHFVLNEFEGPVFEAIHKNKQCIMGPPALKRAAEMKDGLIHNLRPIYNYAMRGVVTCFTSIRKKDELTKLVNLIHSMGGCIRKDLYSKVTHLICVQSGGDKYRYAKTFRLTIVRPEWVYAAWEHRNDINFHATTEDFSKEHKLKVFEGQKICFFGFPSDEHQHMVDVLKSNGGIPAELDDPECSHVVMPNSGGYFLETLTNATNIPKPKDTTINIHNANPNDMEVDVATAAVAANNNKMTPMENKENAANAAEINIYNNNKNVLSKIDDDDDEDDDHFDERLVVDYESNDKLALQQHSPISDDLDIDDNANASTPKTSKIPCKSPQLATEHQIEIDGIVLSNRDESVFENANNISPILNTSPPSPTVMPAQSAIENTAMETDDMHMDGDEQFLLDEQNELKRKRESFDSVSLVSVESFALPASTKKPKLIRTGSITRSLKRSMSFVAERTPIAKMLRPRRSSVAFDAAPNCSDLTNINADDSICSIISVESTFNESIRKPVKEKLRSIRERITRSSSSHKKEKYIINVPPNTPERAIADEKDAATTTTTTTTAGFKTPKAPATATRLFSTAATATTTATNKATTPKSFLKSSAFLTQPNLTQTNSTINTASTTTTTTFPTFTATTNTANMANNTANTSHPNNTATATKHAVSSSQLMCNQEMQVANNNNNNNNAAIEMQSMQVEGAAVATAAAAAACPNAFKCNNLQNDAGRLNTVVDEHTTQTKPEPKNNRTHILKSDWFWYTIQNDYADEMDYLFGDYLDSIVNTPNTDRRDSLPASFKNRKRKRFSQRLQLDGGTPLGSGKRRSSVSDAGLLSVSGSFFDCTTSPDKLENVKLLAEPEASICETATAKKSMRFNHFMDFFHTESNYVGILETIVNLFKNPLEEIAETNNALLNKSEIKSIFNNFLPIYDVHRSMLERLRAINGKWSEDCLIGDIILHYRDELTKAYPPYVNFFEQMKETLLQCDNQNPRFHAFLKINQTKPECGRQSLQDLMIRPVQRLPSISLLLNDILKHTNKNNPDFTHLEHALKAIKEVMMHINEDKRKTESRVAIFDIFNDIEGCPPHLVSSNRSFISKCEATELSDSLSGRGDTLMLYLFSDTIEVCKKRSRGFNSAKSPSSTKTHKHIKLISLNSIRFVIDITDSPRAFAFLCRHDKDKLYSFTLADEDMDKIVYLKTLCKQMAENACRTDTDKALICRTSQELEVDISDVNLSTLSKAFKLAARTRLKVGRAFSFNKTPSKLKRAVSTMMTSPFGSTNSLTPATQLAQMRLASCTNIHEAADEESSSRSSSPSQSEVLIPPPLSVQPIRKNKMSALTSVRRI